MPRRMQVNMDLVSLLFMELLNATPGSVVKGATAAAIYRRSTMVATTVNYLCLLRPKSILFNPGYTNLSHPPLLFSIAHYSLLTILPPSFSLTASPIINHRAIPRASQLARSRALRLSPGRQKAHGSRPREAKNQRRKVQNYP